LTTFGIRPKSPVSDAADGNFFSADENKFTPDCGTRWGCLPLGRHDQRLSFLERTRLRRLNLCVQSGRVFLTQKELRRPHFPCKVNKDESEEKAREKFIAEEITTKTLLPAAKPLAVKHHLSWRDDFRFNGKTENCNDSRGGF
jgi:hypothetical protein